MSGLPELLTKCFSLGVRLIPVGENELTIDGPKHALTSDLMKQLKAYKSKILAALNTDSTKSEIRRQMYEEFVHQVNAIYLGGPLEWDRLDEIEGRIESAETISEMTRAMTNYKTEVLRQGQRPGSD